MPPASGRCRRGRATIAVVTSPTGAVWKDIATVLARRWPLVRVVLVGAQVQGADAPASIVAAFRRLERHRAELIDAGWEREAPAVTILARGGGSLEDLWPFNDERVVRAVVAHPVPGRLRRGPRGRRHAGRLRGRRPRADALRGRRDRRARPGRDAGGAAARRCRGCPGRPRRDWPPRRATSPWSAARSTGSVRRPSSSRPASASACCSTGRRARSRSGSPTAGRGVARADRLPAPHRAPERRCPGRPRCRRGRPRRARSAGDAGARLRDREPLGGRGDRALAGGRGPGHAARAARRPRRAARHRRPAPGRARWVTSSSW